MGVTVRVIEGRGGYSLAFIYLFMECVAGCAAKRPFFLCSVQDDASV
jgi:hypothetical protein